MIFLVYLIIKVTCPQSSSLVRVLPTNLDEQMMNDEQIALLDEWFGKKAKGEWIIYT